MSAVGDVAQLGQVRSVRADEDGVVIDRAFRSAAHLPIDRRARLRRRQINAVIDAGLDGRAFLIVIPGRYLDCRQLVAAGVEVSCLLKRLLPCLAALLIDLAVGSPRGLGVVEAFVSGRDGQTSRGLLRSLIKTVLGS